MLVDAIIAGVREKRVQERLLERGESLTLNKAIELTQQFEISQKQMKIVDEDSQISAVTVKPKHFTPSKKMPFKGNSNYRKQASINSPKSCTKCGKDPQHSLEISSSKSKTNAMFEILDIAQENVLSGTTAEALGLIAT